MVGVNDLVPSELRTSDDVDFYWYCRCVDLMAEAKEPERRAFWSAMRFELRPESVRRWALHPAEAFAELVGYIGYQLELELAAPRGVGS